MKQVKRTIVYEVKELDLIEPEMEKEWDNGWRTIRRNEIIQQNPDIPMTVEIEYILKELNPLDYRDERY